MIPITGMSVHVSQHLAGSERAFLQGRRLYVSPAMYDLIGHADADELRHLLAGVPVVEIPESWPPGRVPMVTYPPNGWELPRG